MNEEKMDAIKRIKAQLEYGYLDMFDTTDEAEMSIIREAIKEYEENHNLKG